MIRLADYAGSFRDVSSGPYNLLCLMQHVRSLKLLSSTNGTLTAFPPAVVDKRVICGQSLLCQIHNKLLASTSTVPFSKVFKILPEVSARPAEVRDKASCYRSTDTLSWARQHAFSGGTVCLSRLSRALRASRTLRREC